jgi:hypothetical protein
MGADEVREDLIKTGVMRSLLRCVKNNGSHAFNDTPSNLPSVSPHLLECILLCIAFVETYEDDIRGMGKEMEEAVWEVMEEAQERGGGENGWTSYETVFEARAFYPPTPIHSSIRIYPAVTAEAYGQALERLVSVVKKWTDRRRKSSHPPTSSALASADASTPPPSRHLSALLSTPSLPPSPKVPSPVSSSLSTEDILQRLATMSVAVLSQPTIDAEKALRVLHTLTCIRGTLPLLLQLSTLSFLTPFLTTSCPPSTLAAALKSVIGVVGGGDGAYRGFVQGENE